MSKWKIGLILGLVINMSWGDLAYHQKRFKLNHQEVSGLYSNITGQIKKFSEILEDPKSYTMPDVSAFVVTDLENQFAIVSLLTAIIL